MKKIMSRWPLVVLMMPVFFVLHGCNENFGFISFRDAALLAGFYCVVAVAIFTFFYFFFRDKIKASLCTTYALVCYLFFGYIKDFLKTNIRFLSKYSILLSILFVLMILLFVLLKRSRKNFSKFVLYLNIIFLIYLVIDSAAIIIKRINPPANKFSVFPFAKKNSYENIDNMKKPDIYFLLFDEYGSSLSLKRLSNFNNDLDSFLEQKGFHIQRKSYSNYNVTPLSIASLLNMSYLKGISGETRLVAEDYSSAANLIRDNEVIKFLSANGYNIVNYSVFDLAGNPASVTQSFLPLKTRLITDNTIFSRIYKDLGWQVYDGRWKINALVIRNLVKLSNTNANTMHDVIKKSAENKSHPNFIYAHFMLPHHPYYFNKKGELRDIKSVMDVSDDGIKAYLEYLEYGNTKIKELVSAIQSNTKNNAVIIVMGDHGFRHGPNETLQAHTTYQNMNAVFFPDKDYHFLYDSISCVNQFRVILNTIFRQSFPLERDSTVHVKIPDDPL